MCLHFGHIFKPPLNLYVDWSALSLAGFHFCTEMKLVHQQRFPTSEDIAFWDYKVSSCPVIFAWFISNFENHSNNFLGSLTILQNLQALSHTNFFAEPVRVVAIVLFQNSWHLKVKLYHHFISTCKLVFVSYLHVPLWHEKKIGFNELFRKLLCKMAKLSLYCSWRNVESALQTNINFLHPFL